MSTTTMATGRERFWVPGDWNAFFGFGTNILVNVLVLTGLLRFVLKMPDSLVFGRILPALGLMLFLSTVYYAWLAYRLAQKTGRTDVTALPSGTSVPHMFVVTFVVMLPILAVTKDPVQAWEAGLTWVFVQSFVLMIGGLSVASVGDAFSHFGFSIPLPAVGHVFSGFKFLGVILVTAIPFGIYDLVEAMDNVESAAAAGDSFPTTSVLTADGVISLIGCLMGNPFINAVYIGHPGWKAMGGRIGYSAATGVMVILLSWFGIISVMMALIPVVAISPILLYIGMLIGAQAFQENPKSHAPAIILALTPHLAAWGKLQIDNSLAAAGTNAGAIGLDKLAQTGVLYHGLQVLGGGAILAGLILGAIGVFIIEREFMKAAYFATAGAILTFFGFIHGEKIGFAQTPAVSVSYLAVAAVLIYCAKFALVSEKPAEVEHTGELRQVTE